MKIVNRRNARYEISIARDSEWGNPFKMNHERERGEVIEKYRVWVLSDAPDAKWIRENIKMLDGKTCGCWCAPLPCHGDVLLELLIKQR